MAPVAAANSPPAPATATTPPATTTMMAMVPATMGNLLEFDFVIPFEDSRIRLVQLIENSVALGNTRNRAAGSC
ncbi:hypothetical protein [Mesorhizobium sp. B2-3-4]|uniref:hypothetical protein n=1 Tax=Mesorhizobium sp. B2-3-4 TaxID=2589959 RepID=UPI0015E3D822|nr:hypothetical protein [Mesorhizobium sp. B2-3-4]